MHLKRFIYYYFITCVFIFLLPFVSYGQSILDRKITVNHHQTTVVDLLNDISKKANFYFSYSSDVDDLDNLVSINLTNHSVREILDKLFQNNIEYKEVVGYIVLRATPNRFYLTIEENEEMDGYLEISGHVVDAYSRKGIQDVSIYDKRLLGATLTDENGRFRLKLKSDGLISLTASKKLYKDTTINLLSIVNVSKKTKKEYTYSVDTNNMNIIDDWLGRRLISSKMKNQSRNISEIISGIPIQTSILPGVGTHGSLSSQIVNNFSYNILGGYNAGVRGLEIAGLYNINKENVKYIQAAGLFNLTGGNVVGLSMAGLSNIVYRDLKGVQVASIYNIVKGNSYGIQLAGIANLTNENAKGLQIAGFVNRAKAMNGVHVALFNVADTLNGYAFNLLSFSRNGYKQLGIYLDENAITTVSYKTGNPKLYTKIIAGMNFFNQDRYYTYGVGVGHDFLFKNNISLSTEFDFQFVSSSKWNNTHLLDRLNILLNIPINSKINVFTGPSFNLYDLGQNNTAREEDFFSTNRIGMRSIGRDFKSWLGWSFGVTLF